MRPLRTSVFITVNRAESPHLVPLPWKCHSGSEHLDPSISILSPFLASRPFMIIPPKCFPVSSPVLQPKGTTHSSPRHTLAHISHFHLCTLSSFLLHVPPFLPLCCPPLPKPFKILQSTPTKSPSFPLSKTWSSSPYSTLGSLLFLFLF